MIFRLAIAQARAQKRYTIWTASLLTFVLTLTTFGLILAANQQVISDHLQAVWLHHKATEASVTSVLALEPADSPLAESFTWEGSVPADELDRAIADAAAAGSDLIAMRTGHFTVTDPGIHDGSSLTSLEAAAVTGDVDWGLVLSSGHAPASGEIALSANKARGLGLEIGDRLGIVSDWALYGLEGFEAPTDASWRGTYVVSGITKSCGDYFGYNTNCPEAYLPWDTTIVPSGPFSAWNQIDFEGTTSVSTVDTHLAWTVSTLAMSALTEPTAGYSYGTLVGSQAPGTYLAVGVASVFVVGMVVMAFAVGRSQAQARLQWVATARTLGATRRAVMTASLAETFLVGTAATVAGLILGNLVAIAHRAIHVRTVASPFIPDALVRPWWVAGAVAASGLVLAGIVAVVPAFWASRVSPVAALKPVNEVMEAEMSRRVSAWWVVPPFALSLVVMVLEAVNHGPTNWVTVIAVIAFGVTGFALLQESLRALVPLAGRWLSARVAPWAIAAGNSLTARPRQGVAPAMLQAMAAGTLGFGIAQAGLDSRQWLEEANPDGTITVTLDPLPWRLFDASVGAVLGILGFFLIVQVIVLAIASIGYRATAGDDATRRALGLSSVHQRRAAALQYAAPQVIGLIVGLFASYGLAVIHHGGAFWQEAPTGASLVTLVVATTPSIVGWCAGIAALAAIVIAVGAAIFAATTSSRTPVEALRQVG